MKLQGISNANGTYTVKIEARWRWLRKAIIWLLTVRADDNVLTKSDRHIIFDHRGQRDRSARRAT